MRPCPCGSGSAFDRCCGPYLGGAPAPTAVALMRSRYTAFALGDEDHLFRTWHPRTRPRPPYWAPGTSWTGLRVVAVEGGGEADEEGIVTFEASWRDGTTGRTGAQRERSRFERRRGLWVYVSGTDR